MLKRRLLLLQLTLILRHSELIHLQVGLWLWLRLSPYLWLSLRLWLRMCLKLSKRLLWRQPLKAMESKSAEAAAADTIQNCSNLR